MRNRFAPALRRVARDLDLPRSVRAAILLEMAADLEAMYDHHRQRGASDDEAVRRAEEAVLGSSEVVRRLGRLHHGSWRGWSEDLGSRLSGGADLLLLLVGVVPMFGLAGAVSARVLAYSVSPLVWVLIAVGLCIAGIIAMEIRRLVGGGRGRPRGLPLILVLSALAPAIGMLALALGIHSTSMSLTAGIPHASTQIALAAQLGRDGVLLLIGLLLGIAGALSWFVLLNRASLRAEREVDALLQDTAPPVHGSRVEGIIPLVKGRQA